MEAKTVVAVWCECTDYEDRRNYVVCVVARDWMEDAKKWVDEANKVVQNMRFDSKWNTRKERHKALYAIAAITGDIQCTKKITEFAGWPEYSVRIVSVGIPEMKQ